MKLLDFPHSNAEEPFACPIGEALWLDYRQRNPDGPTNPPTDGRNVKDPELLPYILHFDRCDDCNEI